MPFSFSENAFGNFVEIWVYHKEHLEYNSIP